jgi:D-alanyl-D-alanine carboxypeptidase/D-alanyl-D-alanine-endopeptidase (penicillin-binding protein 4)
MRLILLLLCLMAAPTLGQSEFELSYLLVRSSDGKVIEEQEADKLRIPASTLKTLTAAASLDVLGSDHIFHTTLHTEALLRRGRLRGSLSLRGEADPELSDDALRSLVRQLRESGLRVVEGDLVVDPGPYAFPLYGPGWAWDDAGLSYSPEITGLNLDGGLVALDPENLPPWVIHTQSEESVSFLVPGQRGVQAWGELPESISPPRVPLRTGERLRVLMAEQGIRLEGEVREGKAMGEQLAEHSSRPLQQILKKALAVSDNLAMELLYRASGQELPASLAEKKLRVVDGSGLSRYNLISCRLLVHLLRSADLRAVLPAPGEGTLRTRFLAGWARGHLLAKTGSMSNVSAITGYLFPGTDKECVFAIMLNGHLGSTSQRKAIEDEMVERWTREIGWPYTLKSTEGQSVEE